MVPSETFLEYVTLRQEVWLGLEAMDKPFTNNWRELDRTTSYYINTVYPVYDSLPDLILETVGFRAFGRQSTDEAVREVFGSWIIASTDPDELEMFLLWLPHSAFTSAYMPYTDVRGASQAINRLRNGNGQIAVATAVRAGDMDEAHRLLVQSGLGDFTATHALLDLTWTGGPRDQFGEAVFHPGAGAVHGLQLATGQEHTSQALYRSVSADIDSRLPNTLRPVIRGSMAKWGLRETEQALCEYSRYVRDSPTLGIYARNKLPLDLPTGWGYPDVPTR